MAASFEWRNEWRGRSNPRLCRRRHTPETTCRESPCLAQPQSSPRTLIQSVNLCDAAQMTFFGDRAGKPYRNDLAHLIVGNHFSTEGEYIGAVMFAAVPRTLFVITHRRANARNLVGDHARPDPGAVDHDA